GNGARKIIRYRSGTTCTALGGRGERRRRARAEHEVNSFPGPVVVVWPQLGIDAERLCRRGVTEALLHLTHARTVSDQQRCEEVPQVVVRRRPKTGADTGDDLTACAVCPRQL